MEFERFIEEQDIKLRNKFNLDEEKVILARSLKLQEEVGELSNEILSHLLLQRDDKLEENTKENLENEIADVIIVTNLLAKTLNINVNKAINNKISKINDRNKK